MGAIIVANLISGGDYAALSPLFVLLCFIGGPPASLPLVSVLTMALPLAMVAAPDLGIR